MTMYMQVGTEPGQCLSVDTLGPDTGGPAHRRLGAARGGALETLLHGLGGLGQGPLTQQEPPVLSKARAPLLRQ